MADGRSVDRVQRFRHHPLVGTTVEITVAGVDAATASELDRIAVAEMVRLEAVFSAFDPDSELSRWKRDALERPSPELTRVMADALRWQERSGGRFNPLAGEVVLRWRRAEAAAVVPDADELAALAASIAAPRYHLADGVPVRTGDCSHLDLNALAKGAIVDVALARAVEHEPDASVVVNAGGDLAHRGPASVRVDVENPLRPYDNEPPLTSFELTDAAVATSGGARRGFDVAGHRHSHVIDPRTGRTADRIAAITVVAADAATADVTATVLGVVDPAEAIDEAPRLGVACLVVAPDGGRWVSRGWRA